jgi:hypothetical protein
VDSRRGCTASGCAGCQAQAGAQRATAGEVTASQILNLISRTTSTYSAARTAAVALMSTTGEVTASYYFQKNQHILCGTHSNAITCL